MVKQLGPNLKTDHPVSMCGKIQVSVSLIESLDADICSDNPSEYEGCSDIQPRLLIVHTHTLQSLKKRLLQV